MPKPKAEPVKAPFQQQQAQTNTYAPISVADTPEARAFLSQPLDFGSEVSVDPGVGRRTDLAEQEAENRYNSAFSMGTPRIIRQAYQAKELRDIRGQGAAEAQQAEYANQIANNQRRQALSLTELERKRQMVPQIFQTGGSGTSSGFNTQVMQPQGGGFLSSFAGGLGSGLGGALPFI
jgi:hypothetical protein